MISTSGIAGFKGERDVGEHAQELRTFGRINRHGPHDGLVEIQDQRPQKPWFPDGN